MVDAQEITNNGTSENDWGRGASFSLILWHLQCLNFLLLGLCIFLLLFLMLKYMWMVEKKDLLNCILYIFYIK